MSPDAFDENEDRSSDGAEGLAVDPASFAWPGVRVDPIQKMKAIAAHLPYVAADEAVFEMPFDRFWSFIEDFETTTPIVEGTVDRLEVTERNGERLRLRARSPIGFWDEFDVLLRPGFCVMQGRSGKIGMAARAESETRTRYFHFEGTPLLGRIARPFFAWNIRQDFRRIRTALGLPLG